ncbi:MAG: hypothetical protein ACXAC2_17740 [Candidatus Kariarchaeaceae archaeon]|jgi:hypothetical protein
MKTYSIAFKSKAGHWYTNYYEYPNLNEIDWEQVETFAKIEDKYLAYGYYYGHNSNQLISKKCRTVLWRK